MRFALSAVFALSLAIGLGSNGAHAQERPAGTYMVSAVA